MFRYLKFHGDKSPERKDNLYNFSNYHSDDSILLVSTSSLGWKEVAKSSSLHCQDGKTGLGALTKHRDDKLRARSLGP